jgi:hypothetical protein
LILLNQLDKVPAMSVSLFMRFGMLKDKVVHLVRLDHQLSATDVGFFLASDRSTGRTGLAENRQLVCRSPEAHKRAAPLSERLVLFQGLGNCLCEVINSLI